MKQPSITTFTLVFMITGAIDSIRNLPTAALFGTSLFFFFILAVLLFLLPVGLISAALAARYPEQGGIYFWVRLALGEKFAFLAIWLQWVNTLVWLPSILSFLAGTSAYLINPVLAHDKFYLISVMLTMYWTLTWINLKGISASAKISSFCAIFGTMLPIGFIITLGAIWLTLDKPLQIDMSWSAAVPQFSQMNSWVSLTAIITSFLGLELATVHVRSIHDPQHTFPKALAISVMVIIATIFFGALTIAFVLPFEKISLISGTAETFSYFLSAFHLKGFLPYIILTMLIGSYGGIISWIISPLKGLMQAVELGYFPAYFSKENAQGAPSNLLIAQAILVTILSLLFLLVPSVNEIYWLLTDLSTQLYVLMYVLMFIAALALSKQTNQAASVFKIPGGRCGYVSICILGLLGCLLTLLIGFFPPSHIAKETAGYYPFIFGGACLLMILPILVFYFYKYKQPLKASPLVEPTQ